MQREAEDQRTATPVHPEHYVALIASFGWTS